MSAGQYTDAAREVSSSHPFVSRSPRSVFHHQTKQTFRFGGLACFQMLKRTGYSRFCRGRAPRFGERSYAPPQVFDLLLV